MGSKTKIDWCDASWNPVTGCLHECEYCYARRIAERFKGCDKDSTYGMYAQATWRRVNPGSDLSRAIFEIEAKCPPIRLGFNPKTQKRKISVAPYPWGFQPTLHKNHLDDPAHWKTPRTIFVCSMADLFGDWVPLEWIQQVFKACAKAPQHRYLFLTKNPARYYSLASNGLLPREKNFWYGSSVPTPTTQYFFSDRHNTFVSIEPILQPFDEWEHVEKARFPGWIIIGAETGNRKDKVKPKKRWIDAIVTEAQKHWMTPVFMKESLRELMGADFEQTFPWG